MKILDRYKKKEMRGFKEFVTTMEVQSRNMRASSFLLASFEDPVYMSWVAKNLFEIRALFDFDTPTLEKIFTSLPESGRVLALAFHQSPYEELLLELLPFAIRKDYNNEVDLIKGVKPALSQQEQAQFAVIKSMRNLQQKDAIIGPQWRLPELGVVRINKNLPMAGVFESNFEDGRLALKGNIKNQLRDGLWQHYYTNGKLFAEGEYNCGYKEGNWTMFYPNGKMKSQGQYFRNKKIDEWKYWDRFGQMRVEVIDYNNSEGESEGDGEAE